MKFTSYKKSDSIEIKQLFEDVFTDSEGVAEGTLIANLVVDLISSTQDQDIVGFVAKDENKIIGSIFFTRLSFGAPIVAFILAPVAVRTEYQGKGIGQKLINFGIEKMKGNGTELVFTYGDPNFYSKVGFESITEEIVKAPLELTYPEGWLCQSLTGNEISPIAEKPRCVAALNKPEYW
jgi:putative acetyltransferase